MMRDELAQVGPVGPFFSVRTERVTTGAGGAGPRDEGYLPLAELYTMGRLGERVAVVAARLGAPEPRVAASLAFQGLAARLWSVALGAAVLSGRVPDIDGERFWWHPERSAPHELWLPDPVGLAPMGKAPSTAPTAPTAPAGPAEQVREAVLAGHLVPLHHATRAVCPVSERLLWGNAGSALAGTLRVLRAWCHGQGRPEQAESALAITRILFEQPPLSDTGTLGPDGEGFRRRSCCLYYRVPGGGLCGDCVLGPLAARRGATRRLSPDR